MGCDMQREPEQQAALYANICLPIDNTGTMGRRVLGDPGTWESFELPKYVYIFIMKQEGSEWSVWKHEERVLSEGEWARTRYYGLNNSRGDSIFQYREKMRFFLVGEKIKGRVFAICSNQKLTFNNTMQSINDMEDLLNLKFNTAPDSIQANLQNIYSTPYNYERNGSYYCSFDCLAGNAYTIDLILYHVAAKVDIKWRVDPAKRVDKETPANGIRVTSMKACNLFNGNAYCFKPMANSVGETPLATGDTITIVQPTDEGLWWEGRSYFYTIPYTTTTYDDYFPLQMEMETNSSGNKYRPTIYMEIDNSSPFVPWLRANFNVTKPLVAKTEEKRVDR